MGARAGRVLIRIWIVANPDLVVGESLSAAVLSVVHLDQSDALALTHIGIPPRVLLLVRVGESVEVGVAEVPSAATSGAVSGSGPITVWIRV